MRVHDACSGDAHTCASIYYPGLGDGDGISCTVAFSHTVVAGHSTDGDANGTGNTGTGGLTNARRTNRSCHANHPGDIHPDS